MLVLLEFIMSGTIFELIAIMVTSTSMTSSGEIQSLISYLGGGGVVGMGYGSQNNCPNPRKI